VAKLNQIIAVCAGKKSRAQKLLTSVHRSWDGGRLNGLSRTYQPLDEEQGERFPPEQRKLQTSVGVELKKFRKEVADFMDVVATQEEGNTGARADVVVDGQVVLPQLPVTVLLFLERQLVDLHTLVTKLPILATDKEWTWDPARNCYSTAPEKTIKTKKMPHTHVKFEPTEHHPGQAEILMIDELVGHWTTTHFSGAMPAEEQAKMLERVEKLQDAVKAARELANSAEVVDTKIGETVLSHIFGD
jgi:hypothetical protein